MKERKDPSLNSFLQAASTRELSFAVQSCSMLCFCFALLHEGRRGRQTGPAAGNSRRSKEPKGPCGGKPAKITPRAAIRSQGAKAAPNGAQRDPKEPTTQIMFHS